MDNEVKIGDPVKVKMGPYSVAEGTIVESYGNDSGMAKLKYFNMILHINVVKDVEDKGMPWKLNFSYLQPEYQFILANIMGISHSLETLEMKSSNYP